MAVTSGFFNSLNGDRKYDARDVSSMFDGLITDGIFSSIGTAFVVKATSGQTVTVGIGKAWFDRTWTINDSILPLTAPDSEVLLDRIDAVVLEIDNTPAVRQNSIKIISGNPSSSPQNPTMANDEYFKQIPLAYIYRKFGTTEIRQADITNTVGTDEAPFILAILETLSIDELMGQWRDKLDQFVENEEAEFDQYIADKESEVDNWILGQETEMRTWFEELQAEMLANQQYHDDWIASEEADFLAWYHAMKDQLSEDAAGNLQLNIDREEVERVLLNGFVDGSKTFSEDGTVIIATAADGRTLTKTFSADFLNMTNVLKSSTGATVAIMTKTFNAVGTLIDMNVTYY